MVSDLRVTAVGNSTGLLNQEIWADCPFLYKSGFWQNFAITSPETLYTKNVVNKLSFLVVTHMTCLNIRFGRYGFLKSGFSARQIRDRLCKPVLCQVFGPQHG
jgi:hypothetical protein